MSKRAAGNEREYAVEPSNSLTLPIGPLTEPELRSHYAGILLAMLQRILPLSSTKQIRETSIKTLTERWEVSIYKKTRDAEDNMSKYKAMMLAGFLELKMWCLEWKTYRTEYGQSAESLFHGRVQACLAYDLSTAANTALPTHLDEEKPVASSGSDAREKEVRLNADVSAKDSMSADDHERWNNRCDLRGHLKGLIDELNEADGLTHESIKPLAAAWETMGWEKHGGNTQAYKDWIYEETQYMEMQKQMWDSEEFGEKNDKTGREVFLSFVQNSFPEIFCLASPPAKESPIVLSEYTEREFAHDELKNSIRELIRLSTKFDHVDTSDIEGMSCDWEEELWEGFVDSGRHLELYRQVDISRQCENLRFWDVDWENAVFPNPDVTNPDRQLMTGEEAFEQFFKPMYDAYALLAGDEDESQDSRSDRGIGYTHRVYERSLSPEYETLYDDAWSDSKRSVSEDSGQAQDTPRSPPIEEQGSVVDPVLLNSNEETPNDGDTVEYGQLDLAPLPQGGLDAPPPDDVHAYMTDPEDAESSVSIAATSRVPIESNVDVPGYSSPSVDSNVSIEASAPIHDSIIIEASTVQPIVSVTVEDQAPATVQTQHPISSTEGIRTVSSAPVVILAFVPTAINNNHDNQHTVQPAVSFVNNGGEQISSPNVHVQSLVGHEVSDDMDIEIEQKTQVSAPPHVSAKGLGPLQGPRLQTSHTFSTGNINDSGDTAMAGGNFDERPKVTFKTAEPTGHMFQALKPSSAGPTSGFTFNVGSTLPHVSSYRTSFTLPTIQPASHQHLGVPGIVPSTIPFLKSSPSVGNPFAGIQLPPVVTANTPFLAFGDFLRTPMTDKFPLNIKPATVAKSTEDKVVNTSISRNRPETTSQSISVKNTEPSESAFDEAVAHSEAYKVPSVPEVVPVINNVAIEGVPAPVSQASSDAKPVPAETNASSQSTVKPHKGYEVKVNAITTELSKALPSTSRARKLPDNTPEDPILQPVQVSPVKETHNYASSTPKTETSIKPRVNQGYLQVDELASRIIKYQKEWLVIQNSGFPSAFLEASKTLFEDFRKISHSENTWTLQSLQQIVRKWDNLRTTTEKLHHLASGFSSPVTPRVVQQVAQALKEDQQYKAYYLHKAAEHQKQTRVIKARRLQGAAREREEHSEMLLEAVVIEFGDMKRRYQVYYDAIRAFTSSTLDPSLKHFERESLEHYHGQIVEAHRFLNVSLIEMPVVVSCPRRSNGRVR